MIYGGLDRMEREDVRRIIERELPALMQQDAQIRAWIRDLIRQYAPEREETESRFDRLLAELRAMREESERRWEEQNRKWEEQNRKWEEQNRKWEENQQQIREILAAIKRVDYRIERTIGALGARWGLSSEATFRKALRAILEESFGVTVERVEFWDEAGEVFGRPDQVELDVIIRDGQILVCELKSSASRSDVYSFERKVRLYEKRTGQQARRMILISPMVDERARQVAADLGIEVYSDAADVTP